MSTKTEQLMEGGLADVTDVGPDKNFPFGDDIPDEEHLFTTDGSMSVEYQNHLLRKLLKEHLRNEIRVMAPNEYRREIHSISNKIGEHPELVEFILTPIIRELMEEMLEKQDVKNNRKGGRRRKNRNRH